MNINYKDDLIKDENTIMRSYSLGGSLNEGFGRAILPPTTNRLNPQHGSIKSKNMKKNKFLIYTSNLDIMPKSMADVINFAETNNKYMIANVELNSCLANVKEGDNIFTKKGNSLYVIRTFSESLEDLPDYDRDYIENLTRMGKLKKVNITSVSKIVGFSTWCKTAKPLIKEETKSSKKMKNNSIDSMMDRIKDMFQPTEADGVRLTMTDFNICVETAEGYVAIDANNNLVSYPEELTMDLPVYEICKPKDQLKVGDIIKAGKSYAKVTKIEGEKINAISYTGTGKVVHTIKDFLFNQTMVRVLVSLTNMAGGQLNSMALIAMTKGSKSSMLPFLLMNGMGQQNNAGNLGGLNPMVLMAMKGDDNELSMKDLFMMSAISGQQNMFGGLFGGQPQAPVQ